MPQVGAVELGAGSSVWYASMLKADTAPVTVGDMSSVGKLVPCAPLGDVAPPGRPKPCPKAFAPEFTLCYSSRCDATPVCTVDSCNSVTAPHLTLLTSMAEPGLYLHVLRAT